MYRDSLHILVFAATDYPPTIKEQNTMDSRNQKPSRPVCDDGCQQIDYDYMCECDQCSEYMTCREFDDHECPATKGIDVKDFDNFQDYLAAADMEASEWRKRRRFKRIPTKMDLDIRDILGSDTQLAFEVHDKLLEWSTIDVNECTREEFDFEIKACFRELCKDDEVAKALREQSP